MVPSRLNCTPVSRPHYLYLIAYLPGLKSTLDTISELTDNFPPMSVDAGMVRVLVVMDCSVSSLDNRHDERMPSW
jgi:hypothetical protein